MTLFEFVRSPVVRWSYALVIALGGCGVRLNPNDPPVVPSPERGTCGEMCRAFERLGCETALPSPRLGVTCTARCERALASGAIQPPIDCVVSAKSVEALEICGERCR